MMDIEKLIHCLQCCSKVDAHNIGCDDCGLEYCGPECQQLCGTAATALSTLQIENQAFRNSANGFKAENEKLREELESLKKGHCAGCSVQVVETEALRDLNDAPKLRAELEQVKQELDTAVECVNTVYSYILIKSKTEAVRTIEKWLCGQKEG